MNKEDSRLAGIRHLIYGPVPSRRLGRSLGINNIPPKICSYSCVYCQLGNTVKMQAGRESFYEAEDIAQCVAEKVEQLRERGEPVDYLTFVSDGEPTLDINLGGEIELLKPLGIKVAVITNASLISHDGVRQDLQKADWVSLKVDAVSTKIWRGVSRPHKSLKLETILEGMLKFADIYRGELATETMLVQGINDNADEVEKIANFLVKLKPNKSYLAIPIRPPAKATVTAASEEAINMAYQIFSNRLNRVEYLIGYEGNDFSLTGNVKDDLLSITSIHPMREEAVIKFLKKANADWRVIGKLIEGGDLIELEYQGRKFYMRKLPRKKSTNFN